MSEFLDESISEAEIIASEKRAARLKKINEELKAEALDQIFREHALFDTRMGRG